MRYIQKLANSGAVQTALDQEELGKPYMVYLEDEHRIDWNSLSPGGPDYRAMPLTFDILSDGVIVWKAAHTAATRTIEYKLNNGEWTSLTSAYGSSAPSISVVSGDTIQFRGNNNTYSPRAFRYSCFSGSTANFNVKGNIMSLINSTNFENLSALTSDYTFQYLFAYCPTLKSIDNLILPAVKLRIYCYDNMFYKSTGLITAENLVLPATTLTTACYQGMFAGTNITKAPELPAPILVNNCYKDMFQYCPTINYVKCLATNVSATDCIKSWLNVAPSSGTFVKDPNMASWPTGGSGIPDGWTVVDADI